MITSLKNNDSLVVSLLIMIVVLFIASLFFFILTFISRGRRIKKIQRKKEYQKAVDELLFTMLFNDNQSVYRVAEQFNTGANQSKLLKKIAIKSINALHKNYSGELKKKLEKFYKVSGLVNYSLKKINSINSAKVVEAIRDLSNLNYQKAYDEIVKRLKHSDQIVQKEAFIGIILLKGLDGLILLKDSTIILDDWTQSNILYFVKRNHMQPPINIEILLSSTNPSIVLLAGRLIEYYNLSQHVVTLEDIGKQEDFLKIKPKLALICNRIKNNHQIN